MSEIVRELLPPILVRALRKLRRQAVALRPTNPGGTEQDLDIYWDPKMAEMLENWGEGNAWNDIRLLMAARKGRVLDIACGTGRTMELLNGNPDIEVHGCDISDMLIGKAVARGIPEERLLVADATAMVYPDAFFDWAYSIGSLEHFTADGIEKFLKECRRVARHGTFHMIPVSRSGRDEGWIRTFQSYHNNSATWWDRKCRVAYEKVEILDSSWNDRMSFGKWLICLSS
jgi:ubiquinone/menaquinone biosynthesis C-methylase UbiE